MRAWRHAVGIILRATGIVVVSGSIGLTYNHFSRNGLPLVPSLLTDSSGSETRSYVVFQRLSDDVKPIYLVEAHELYQAGAALFLDARGEKDYAEEHIAGALSVPYESLEGKLEPVKKKLGQRHFELICYCDASDCDLSTKLAEELAARGYAGVRIFFGGWKEWRQARYPSSKTSTTAKRPSTAEERRKYLLSKKLRDDTKSIFLEEAYELYDAKLALFLDARSNEEYESGRIAGALSVPYGGHEGKLGILRDRLRARDLEIICYCDGGGRDLSIALAAELAAMGYPRIRIFFGGWLDWQEAEYPAAQGEQPESWRDREDDESGWEDEVGG